MGAAFEMVLLQHPLPINDRHLANNIIFGVLRNRQSLDCMLEYLCSQPLKKLKPFVHQALRVGLYQIMFLDRIPESAAVNESVKAVQAAKLPKRLHGFVNGVLRNSIRKRKELLECVNKQQPLILNHPGWLQKRWQKHFGTSKARAICEQNNRKAPLILQVNSCTIKRDDFLQLLHNNTVHAEKCHYSESGILLPDFHGSISTLPGFKRGFFQVQDQGAQLLSRLLLPLHQKGKYLDACAGVGGKTSVLIQLLQNGNATLTANEPERERQKKFTENMTRLHPKMHIHLSRTTLQEFNTQSTELFHGILLDAPCSGTGVIGRHPDIRWNRKKEDLPGYQKTQLELLHCASTLLAPDGTLVYATCSLEEEENEQVIDQFLAQHTDFMLEKCADYLPGNCQDLCFGDFFAPLPQEGIDGFFAARLRKI